MSNSSSTATAAPLFITDLDDSHRLSSDTILLIREGYAAHRAVIGDCISGFEGEQGK